MNFRRLVATFSLAMVGLTLPLASAAQVALAQASRAPALEASLDALERSLPADPSAFATADTAVWKRLVAEIDASANTRAATLDRQVPAQALAGCRSLLVAKDRVDALLEQTLARRTEFAGFGLGEENRDAVRRYLSATSRLIELSGRLRYLLRDALERASSSIEADPRSREAFIQLLTEHGSQIGAVLLTPLLFDPEPAPGRAAVVARTSDATKGAVLRLLAAAGNRETLLDLAEFLHTGPSASLTLQAAETIREIGLPQDPRPDQDANLPQPAITAEDLHELLTAVDASKLAGDDARRHGELVAWSERRMREGVTEDVYRLGRFDLRPGDWLLMRNPSPYNSFTDLSPGLFTHVGVVTDETGPDGRRRIVLVDMPERGTVMPATNIDLFVERTLHYVVLRHADPLYGKKMADVARAVIGNETQFDLNFRTSRVEELKGQDLEGRKIHTYCAGLLLLCAQETPGARDEFFPLPEYAAAGNTQPNLAKLGLSIGEDFVSPTGALFSPHFSLVARCEPMYEPTREIEEAVFDHFATSLVDKTLRPSASMYQSLRVKLAQAAEVTPLLGRALAAANDVSPDMDLVAAARAAAVVENLDEIAFGTSGEFVAAREAIRAGNTADLVARGASSEEVARVQEMRRRHGDLYQAWRSGKITPRDLRLKLVDYYSTLGKRRIDEQFFSRAP
ncbi:MAG: hypothetical protein KF708_02800 [Pirellulales bacterium]|nr:hypothetical protein [Pirellulales bacterium]